MSLLVKAQREGQTIARVTPESACWRYVGFAAYRLGADEVVHVFEPSREVCIVVLTGAVDIETADQKWVRWVRAIACSRIRAVCAVFAAWRAATVRACRDAEVGVASAPGKGAYPARLIEPSTMKRSTRGKGLNTRYVCDILPQTELAESLLVVEVRTPGGHASSYPPHKHDTDNVPHESSLEETYYHRLDPPQGFAFQRVYTDMRDIDESMAVENHDVVMVPRGYHPVVVPYGYELLLQCDGGRQRVWHFKNDPAHEWIINKDS